MRYFSVISENDTEGEGDVKIPIVLEAISISVSSTYFISASYFIFTAILINPTRAEYVRLIKLLDNISEFGMMILDLSNASNRVARILIVLTIPSCPLITTQSPIFMGFSNMITVL